MKIGNRVTVLPLPDDHPLKHLVGKRGEVEKIGTAQDFRYDHNSVKHSCEGMILVDGQLVNGQRQGHMEMREWFKVDEVEVG